MQPHDCPSWDYEDHPDHKTILPSLCTRLLLRLRAGVLDPLLLSCDTRAAHRFLFSELTPDDYDYFAGHYRGENFRCLKYYDVQVPSDPRVGVYAAGVARAIEYLMGVTGDGITAIDGAYAVPDAHLSKQEKIVYLVVFSTRVLVEFLRVHPYANGNGHMGRFIIFSILAHYNIWPKKWPLDESPSYHQLISDYRSGNPGPLEAFVLNAILGK